MKLTGVFLGFGQIFCIDSDVLRQYAERNYKALVDYKNSRPATLNSTGVSCVSARQEATKKPLQSLTNFSARAEATSNKIGADSNLNCDKDVGSAVPPVVATSTQVLTKLQDPIIQGPTGSCGRRTCSACFKRDKLHTCAYDVLVHYVKEDGIIAIVSKISL